MEYETQSSPDTDLTKISEFEPSFMPTFPSILKNIDISQCILRLEETHRKTREQMPRGPIYSMRSEIIRLKKTILSLEPTSTWAPNELAAAGLYCTGVKNSSQCFCCGLVLCNQSLSKSPMENHWKFSPNCGFIQGKDVGNISKYELRIQPSHDLSLRNEQETMGNEEQRLMSYANWPVYSLIEPAALAQAGFFFTGRRDNVQCFSCKGFLGNWLENDDPWKEHAKWFPKCTFLQSMKTEGEIKSYIKSYNGFADVTGASFTNILDKENLPQALGFKNITFQHFEAVKALHNHLIQTYSDPAFQKSSPFGDTIEMSVDLRSLFADISVVLKDTRNQPVQQLTLPDILCGLSDITMIEGEVGSGKSALLQKIAILWASGTCPILSRFSHVFYISVSSIENHQTLSDIIAKQLFRSTTPVTEETLEEIINCIGNKVLFLVDDYDVMDLAHEVIEELLIKNPANRVSLAVTVRTGKGRKLRQHARTVLSIQEFPLYSTLFLVKRLFPQDIERLRAFFVTLETTKSLQATLQTPLVTLAHCSYWVQCPNARNMSDSHAFKAYLLYHIQKFPTYTEKVKAVVSSCGELSLYGLFQSRFEFTDDDFCQVGVDSEDAINFGLMSKFTAQRLRPMYRFIHPMLQEFLAGKRLSELLESAKQEDLDKGFNYLKHVNTFLKIIGCYHYFLEYALRNSSKATIKILSYLFSLYDSQEALDCHVDNRDHLQRHPELEMPEQMLICILRDIIMLNLDSYKMKLLLTCAIEAGMESQFLSDCAPTIMEFIKKKTLSFSLGPICSALDASLFSFIEVYPESISLLSCIQCSISANDPHTQPDFSNMSIIPKHYGIPTIESEYSPAFVHLDDLIKDNQKKIDETNEFLSLFPQEITISDDIIRALSASKGHKVPLFQIQVTNVNNFSPSNCEKMKVLFSISDHFELKLNNCNSFVQNNWSAIEGNLDAFHGCHIDDTSLSVDEQTLILRMPSLETLHIGGSQETHLPDILISRLHNFTRLTSCSINFPKHPDLVEHLPDDFGGLTSMKKLVFVHSDFTKGASRFAEFLKQFSNLEILFLQFKRVSDFKGLVTSLTSCNKLKQLNLPGPSLQDTEMACLADTLKHFTSLKVLDLKNQIITAQDVSENLAIALGFLVHLEILLLPRGEGMVHAANRVIDQLEKLPALQFISMTQILNDGSITQLGKSAKAGHLRSIHELQLIANDDITESGWNCFFQTACNMPELTILNISRAYTHHIKCNATTVASFVRFISKLPRVLTVVMYGWLLDKGDIDMFNAMKENHPQSKSLNIYWQWVLPFTPKIEN
ncbi:baculoviral IAP repeat-containing protein 1-like [Pelodytes ibericus]